MTRPYDTTRRCFLQSSGVGLAALMTPTLGLAGDTARLPRKAKSVIVLLLEGGMSHFETWDPKPQAPKEIRGGFGQIATANPALTIGEHMPRLAKQAQLYNVVRSVHSAARNHSPGLHWILTGYDNPSAGVNGQRVNTHPSTGAIVAHELGSASAAGLPNFVAVPNRTQLGGRTRFAGASHLGASYEAFESGAVPSSAAAKYVVPAGITLPKSLGQGRLESRRALLSQLDDLGRGFDAVADEVQEYQRQAFGLLLGARGRKAFDINREAAKTRELYGASAMGQGTLLARRLVEAGVHFVLVNYSKNNSWDTHANNETKLKKQLLPPMDQAVSALLSDLQQRGMLDETLVLMMGEMGRTPTINKRAGRDHWPDVYSVLIAGGGLTRGQVLGSSDRYGAKPSDRPVHVSEVLATLYTQLGVHPNLALPDEFGRPVPILPREAYAIAELI